MKNKTNQVSLREEFGRAVRSLELGFSGSQFDFLWGFVQSKLTQILEGLPCEYGDLVSECCDAEFDPFIWEGKNKCLKCKQECGIYYNDDIERHSKINKQTKQYRDKWLKEL